MRRFQRPAGRRLLLGADPAETRVWLTIASRVFVGTLVLALASLAGPTGIVGALVNFLLLIAYFAGIFLALIEGYKNDGLVLSLTVALAPTLAALVAIVVGSVLEAVVGLPPAGVLILRGRLGGLLFVAVGGALFVWIVGVGARRLIEFGGGGGGQVRGP